MNPRSPICPMLSAAADITGTRARVRFRSGHPAAAKVASNPTAAAKTSHTADGHPDLSGVWSSASVTPLERPKDLGAKEFFTKEEAAAYEKRSLAAKKWLRREPMATCITTWLSLDSKRARRKWRPVSAPR